MELFAAESININLLVMIWNRIVAGIPSDETFGFWYLTKEQGRMGSQLSQFGFEFS